MKVCISSLHILPLIVIALAAFGTTQLHAQPLATESENTVLEGSPTNQEEALSDDKANRAPLEETQPAPSQTERTDATPSHQDPVPAEAVAAPPSKKTKTAIQTSSPASGRNALGLTAGLSSGFGLSYKRYVTNFLALRVGGIIAGTQNIFYSVGLSVHEDFMRTYYHRIYAIQAIGISKTGKGSPLVAPGAGLGIEYNFKGLRSGLSVNGELILAPLISGPEGLVFASFLPQLGISYVF